jgi:hypothetical protein
MAIVYTKLRYPGVGRTVGEAVPYTKFWCVGARAKKDRVGGGLTAAVLSHHRTYGSVYGGSGYADKPLIVSSIETSPSWSHSFFGSA